MVHLWSSGCPHLISEGAHVIPCLNGARVVPPSGRRVRHRQDRNDLCFVSHHPSPPLAAKCRTGRGPARAFPAVAGSVLWGGAVLHQFFKVQIVQGGLAGCSGGSSAIRRWYCAAKHGRCSRRMWITSHLSLCGWCVVCLVIRRSGASRWSSPETIALIFPVLSRRTCVRCKMPSPCGSRSRPAPGSG